MSLKTLFILPILAACWCIGFSAGREVPPKAYVMPFRIVDEIDGRWTVFIIVNEDRDQIGYLRIGAGEFNKGKYSVHSRGWWGQAWK
jgi:hypothetical protein